MLQLVLVVCMFTMKHNFLIFQIKLKLMEFYYDRSLFRYFIWRFISSQKHVNLFGKNLFHHKFLKVPKNNLNEFYLNNIKYRLKTSNPLSIIKDEFSKKLYDDLKSEVQNIMNKASHLAQKILIFGNMHLHNFSHHYSFPMIESIRTFSDCRVPALSNELYDLSLSMDPYDKLMEPHINMQLILYVHK